MFIRRYILQDRFAIGGQSTIWSAIDSANPIEKCRCLIKAGPNLRQEAFLSKELNHPFIAAPFDFGQDRVAGPFGVYNESEDPDLREWARKKKKRPGPDRTIVALQMAEVLSFLHNRGWLYNDFKPEHFLIGSRIQVLDLGMCTPVKATSATSKFFGTFPYISPERLAGRPVDARSDIFELGMVLLHSFYPQEAWDFAPSLSTLQELQARSLKLKSPWKEIISEMTAFEPHQRPASAHELWTKLLPANSRRSFLFFPFPQYFSIPDAFLTTERALFVNSSSSIGRDHAERQATMKAWELGISTVTYNLTLLTVDKVFRTIAEFVSGGAAAHFTSALRSLEESTDFPKTMFVFHIPDRMESTDRSLLYVATSSLLATPWAYVLIVGPDRADSLLPANWTSFRVPLLVRPDIERCLSLVAPFNQDIADRVLTRSVNLPEQLMLELKTELPHGSKEAWPAAAHQLSPRDSIDQLDIPEKKLLTTIALAGGNVSLHQVESVIPYDSDKLRQLHNRLEEVGLLRSDGNASAMLVPPSSVLDHLRRHEIRENAKRLFLRWQDRQDFRSLFHLANYAHNNRAAAYAALRISRFPGIGIHQAQSWRWKAFMLGAQLPICALYDLATRSLQIMNLKQARSLITELCRRSPSCLRVSDLEINYHQRRQNFPSAERTAKNAIVSAQNNKNSHDLQYFTARLAGLYILQQKLQEGENLLRGLKTDVDSVPDDVKGLVHHFRALALYYRGQLKDSISESRSAINLAYPLHSTGMLNIGATLLRMKDYKSAEIWTKKAIEAFVSCEDRDRLCHSYNNLGNICKLTARLDEARDYYYRSVHLARSHNNGHMLSAVLINLALLYEVEGRPKRAISFYSKGAAVAERVGSKIHKSHALSNAGLQHALQGNVQKALSLLRGAAKIRRRLGLQVSLAATYEYMGIAFLCAKHWERSIRYFQHARRLFSNAKCNTDASRCVFYRALVMAERGKPTEAGNLLSSNIDQLEEWSFEKGLELYVQAMLILRNPNSNVKDCRDLLHRAERIFQRLPSLFWLAKVHKLKAEYLFRTERAERALMSMKISLDIFSRIGARKQLLELTKEEISDMTVNQELLELMVERLPYKVLVLVKDILANDDPEQIISGILAAALDFTDMERAVLILLQENPPRIYKSASLDEATIQDICEISSSAVIASAETNRPFVCLDANSNLTLRGRKSIIRNHILSIVCLPLRAKGKLLGTLYLDSKEGVESLASTERVLLEIFASIAAIALANGLAIETFHRENAQLRGAVDSHKRCPEVVGVSPQIAQILRKVHSLADKSLPVMITGETGTGKELVARVLHYAKPRKGPFVAINCAAFSSELLESELFGHEKGAFTSANTAKKGLFEHANNGTVLLDEVAEMPFPMQAKLLRVLQDGEFRRVGGLENLNTNARVVLATNRNLSDMVADGTFRQDLYYRVNTVQIHIPPLRERPEDIPLLAAAFLKEAILANSKGNILGFTQEANGLMQQYPWPGNARQLKNEIERIVTLTQEDWITLEDFDSVLQEAVPHVKPENRSSIQSLRQIEKNVILQRLADNDWNTSVVARSLGLSRHGLYSKMRRHNIPRTR